METKIKQLANMLEIQSQERLKQQNLDCQSNLDNAKTSIKIGKKYTRIDIGTSGRLMVDQEGNIFGIKAYGVIHKGHYYGTLNTINKYYWGDYTPRKI